MPSFLAVDIVYVSSYKEHMNFRACGRGETRMNWILIIAITSTMLASGTSSSMTTAVFQTEAACIAAGEKTKKFDKNFFASKTSWLCVPAGGSDEDE